MLKNINRLWLGGNFQLVLNGSELDVNWTLMESPGKVRTLLIKKLCPKEALTVMGYVLNPHIKTEVSLESLLEQCVEYTIKLEILNVAR
jgi:hypothetical protein